MGIALVGAGGVEGGVGGYYVSGGVLFWVLGEVGWGVVCCFTV